MHLLRSRAACLMLCLLVAAASSGAVASSYDFLFSVSYASDDNELFLSLAVGDSGHSRETLEPALSHLHHVGADLPVVLFLARHSNWSVSAIASLRGDGDAWAIVFTKVGVSTGLLFQGIERDPGPPYGKAWGHWKKRNRGFALTDSEIIGLVQIQIGHDLAGVSTFELAQGHVGGVFTVVADKRGRPGKNKSKGAHPGHGKGRGKN